MSLNERTCDNCVYKYMCEDKDFVACAKHIYDTNPGTYDDLQEARMRVDRWIREHGK